MNGVGARVQLEGILERTRLRVNSLAAGNRQARSPGAAIPYAVGHGRAATVRSRVMPERNYKRRKADEIVPLSLPAIT